MHDEEGYAYYRSPNQPIVPKKRRWPFVLGALVLASVILICLGSIVSGSSDAPPPQPGTTPSTIEPPASSGGPKAKTDPEPEPVTLTAKDVKLTVKITDKDCFGSAGCNVNYTIKVATDFEKLKATGKTWDVTYDVKGLEDTQTGTLTLNQDGTYSQDEYQSGQTTSSSKKLSVVVTSIESTLNLTWTKVSQKLSSKKVYVISQGLSGWPVSSAVNWIDGYTGSDWVNASACPRGAYRCIWVKKDNSLRAPVIAATYGYNTSRVVIKVDVAYANSKGIKSQAKRKYVIAHELGHAGFLRAHNGSKNNLMYSRVGGYHYGLTASQKSTLRSH